MICKGNITDIYMTVANICSPEWYVSTLINTYNQFNFNVSRIFFFLEKKKAHL